MASPSRDNNKCCERASRSEAVLGILVQPLLDMLQFDQALAAREQMRLDHAGEMMLAEGAILGILGIGAVLLLLNGLLRRRAAPISAAMLMGLVGLLLAIAFDRLPPLPDGVPLVLSALAGSALVFLMTVALAPARDNSLIGLILLLAVLGLTGMAVADYVGIGSDMAKWVLPTNIALVLFGLLMAAQQGLVGQRSAGLYVLPALLALGALASTQGGPGGWIGAILPFALLTTACVMAGVLSNFATAGQLNDGTGERLAGAGPAPVMAFGSNDGLAEIADERPSRTEPPLAARHQPIPSPAPVQRRTPEPPSSFSASRDVDRQMAATAPARPGIEDVAAILGTRSWPVWEWEDDEVTRADDQAIAASGLTGPADMTPIGLRSLIRHEDLDAFDDAILGGADPAEGRFRFAGQRHDGTPLSIRGMRFVDEDGIVSRIVAFFDVSAGASPAPAPAAAAPRQQRFSRDDIAAALKAGEITTWFQPIVRLPDEATIGFEALARWVRRDGQILQAADFIDDAVDAKLEFDILQIVMRDSIAELADWVRAEPGLGQFVSVNISAESFVSDKLIKLIKAEAKNKQLPKGSLVIEITESQVQNNPSKALKMVKALHAMGVAIGLDDLGAGYASLNQLSRFKFDIVKTDKSLLANVDQDEHAQTLLGGVIDLARKLNMKVIAEGAETDGAVRILNQMNCQMAQGYYFGEPAPADGAPGVGSGGGMVGSQGAPAPAPQFDALR